MSERAAAWSALRGAMIRERPEAFTRDEWAYLIQFLAEDNLRTFVGAGPGRERVTLVMPNNVSLLGPLVMVVATLGARAVRVKLGSRGDDVVTPFVEFARTHGVSDLVAGVECARLGRGDPRLAAWLADADVRVAFGSDAAIAAVAALPHRADSRFLGFGDMYSEAWLDATASDDALDTLIKVFAIYGQAGCTSPRRTVLIGASAADARRFAARLAARWPSVIRVDVPMHLASQNLLAAQRARHAGAEVTLAPRHAAVIAVAPRALEVPSGPLTLVLSPATLDEAAAAVPANLQTIGLALPERTALPHTPARRIVPLARMHHFEPIWDGQSLPEAFFLTAPRREARP